MSDLAVTSSAGVLTPGYAAAQPPEKGAAKPVPKTDVINLSKPPTPEQAERMRSAGILGYGSVSASKHVSTAAAGGGAAVTHFTVDYQSEYFDLVNRTTVRTASSGIGIFASNGSAFTGVTTQVTFSAAHYWPGQLEETVDQLAAVHQTKVSYLNFRFSGQELVDKLSRLDDAYQTSKDKAANSFASMMSQFADQKDLDALGLKLHRGVLDVFARYEEKYSAIASEQKDGSWLGATLYESAVNLRMGASSHYTPPKQNADSSWDLAQWDSVAVSISAYHSILSAAYSGNESEGQLLARFSQVSMKAEAVTVGGRNPGAAELFHISSKHAYLELLTAIGRAPSQQNGFSALA